VHVTNGASGGPERVRTAEVGGALCLATDLATGFPFEHGLRATRIAARLGERLAVDPETASEAYYACLLSYCGCTADAEIAAETYGGDLMGHLAPVLFGSQRELLAGVVRALPDPDSAAPVRAIQVARRLPRAAKESKVHMVALCEVAAMLAVRLGLPSSAHALFATLTDRWDGKGPLRRAEREEIPLGMRIANVAQDAALHQLVGGVEHATAVMRKRAGTAFDPRVVACLADNAAEILTRDREGSAWEETLASEPHPRLTLEGEAVDRALAAMGAFADLVSPSFVGHSAGVAELAESAAERCRLGVTDRVAIRRAALVHDLGRVAVDARAWSNPGSLSADEWEQVRLHPYHTERVLSRSSFLDALAPIAGAHHERLDGSGYHRGATAAVLTPAARLLAAADAYHAMTEPRPHRAALVPERAAEVLGEEARDGRLDADAVAAVLDAAGQAVPRIERPCGLTEREAEVIGLLARGRQTKQVARALDISVKTADRHIQNAYAKIGVSTRAGAAPDEPAADQPDARPAHDAQPDPRREPEGLGGDPGRASRAPRGRLPRRRRRAHPPEPRRHPQCDLLRGPRPAERSARPGRPLADAEGPDPVPRSRA
jgi:HD-GYP domain-containing protein (c-di-GMP phosphodiesterase class II)